MPSVLDALESAQVEGRGAGLAGGFAEPVALVDHEPAENVEPLERHRAGAVDLEAGTHPLPGRIRAGERVPRKQGPHRDHLERRASMEMLVACDVDRGDKPGDVFACPCALKTASKLEVLEADRLGRGGDARSQVEPPVRGLVSRLRSSLPKSSLH